MFLFLIAVQRLVSTTISSRQNAKISREMSQRMRNKDKLGYARKNSLRQ